MQDARVYDRLDMRQMFKISERTLRRWVEQGKLPQPIVEGRWLKEQVDELFRAANFGTSGQKRPRA